jgi:hypothetical protein
VQDLLERFASNPEMRFTPKQHELLGKAYLERRNIIVMEIEWRNELLWEISKWKRNLRRAADAVEAQEVRDELEMEFHHLREWHLDVINKYKLAQQELEKFDNASLANAWKWSVLSLVLSSNDSESDDDVMTDLVQSIAISPSPAPAAVAPAAREDSPVHPSQAEEDDEKAEYEVKVQHDQKNHGPDGDAQE